MLLFGCRRVFFACLPCRRCVSVLSDGFVHFSPGSFSPLLEFWILKYLFVLGAECSKMAQTVTNKKMAYLSQYSTAWSCSTHNGHDLPSAIHLLSYFSELNLFLETRWSKYWSQTFSTLIGVYENFGIGKLSTMPLFARQNWRCSTMNHSVNHLIVKRALLATTRGHNQYNCWILPITYKKFVCGSPLPSGLGLAVTYVCDCHITSSTNNTRTIDGQRQSLFVSTSNVIIHELIASISLVRRVVVVQQWLRIFGGEDGTSR